MSGQVKQRNKRGSGPASARILPLSVLPVFFNLHNKRVVVIGGSDAAAWKAELLAAAGAFVDVFATAPSEQMLKLGGLLASDQFRIRRRVWTPASFTNAAIIVADATSDDEACEIRHAANAAGVPVNVIDRPEHCEFQFGSIVNRSPVVVGISTDGAAPILGQAIRRRIEALMPFFLSGWAALAKKMRAIVNERLEPGRQRRVFWERFSQTAFSRPCHRDEPSLLDDVMDTIAVGVDQTVGRITIVGTGPGDPELLTIKAVQALQSADVIFYDHPSADRSLELARREAERKPVEPMAADKMPSTIELLCATAAGGRHVVWATPANPGACPLASGLADRLKIRGLPVSIVPGLSMPGVEIRRKESRITPERRARSARFAGSARNLPGQRISHL